jgi:hypothetical protein
MCGKREGCYADCKNNPAYRLLRERLSMCEARVKWRNIPISLIEVSECKRLVSTVIAPNLGAMLKLPGFQRPSLSL